MRVRGLTQGFAAIAARCGVAFLDLCAALDGNTRYAKALSAGNGVIPGADGQTVIAERLGAWLAWRDWLDKGTTLNLCFAPAPTR